jgi:hypothetical protein
VAHERHRDSEAGGRIHPHFGVFAPIRREYVDLVATTPLPAACASASLLSISARAPVCSPRYWHGVASNAWSRPISIRARWPVRARTFDSLGLSDRIDVVEANLFPEGRAALVICNPPWIPARPTSPMENGIYDPESRMLRGFLAKLSEHLEPGR